MAKALKHYIDLAEHAAGGRFDPRLDHIQIINEAGRHLCAMHQWTWLERPSASLDLVADQDYVTLPSDFGQLTAITVADGIETHIALTSLGQLQSLRSSVIDDPMRYWVAVEYAVSTDESSSSSTVDTTSNLGPRLAIWPTPGTSAAGALKINYRAGWVDLSSLNDVPNIPADIELLFGEMVRAFVLGRVQEVAGAKGGKSLLERLEELDRSALLNRIRTAYGLVPGSLGPMVGGATQTDDDAPWRPYRRIVRA